MICQNGMNLYTAPNFRDICNWQTEEGEPVLYYNSGNIFPKIEERKIIDKFRGTNVAIWRII